MKLPALNSYISRIGAEQLNFRRYMIKDHKGAYYTERAYIKVNPDGTIWCSNIEYAPTEEEAKDIAAEIIKIDFPRAIEASESELDELRKKVRGALFPCYSRATGCVVMAQERVQISPESKAYLPWTLFSDGEWRQMEPDGALPFWKPKERRKSSIMIHEGAKSAEYVERLIAEGGEHPWMDVLSRYEHWGILGGALAPHRADYQELVREKPTEVIYVCDNDWQGKSMLQEVARHYGKAMKGIMFDNMWPPSWDLADPMPKAMFTKAGRYIGPPLEQLTRHATFATELIPNKKGRPTVVLRRSFREEWYHCVVPEVYINKEWPDRVLGPNEFNNDVRPFSDVDDTARLLKMDAASKTAILRYAPGYPPGIFGAGGEGRFINTHRPSDIKGERGSAAPWMEFMEHLIPDDGDRLETLRWVATLIARPATRMHYGLLLISERQGVGKGTLGEKILCPIIGKNNVSYPTEELIVNSQYNYWLAHKRLAVVHEIYAGHSSKAYNRLKSTITDKHIQVSKKYMANYEIENWIHIFACSNSMRAIQLSSDDRRWFVPRVTDEKKPSTYWAALNLWLNEEGGLQIIRGWADTWLKKNDPVLTGDDAPWSTIKMEVIEEGMSPGQHLVAHVLKELKSEINGEQRALVADTHLVQLIKDQLYDGRHNDRLERPLTIRKVAKAMGWHVSKGRAHIKEWGTRLDGPRLICSHEEDANRAPGELAKEGRTLVKIGEFYNKHKGL